MPMIEKLAAMGLLGRAVDLRFATSRELFRDKNYLNGLTPGSAAYSTAAVAVTMAAAIASL